MPVSFQLDHQALGDWNATMDMIPRLRDELVDADDEPKRVHVRFYDPNDVLLYTGILFRYAGDEKTITIGGRGMLWYLGTNEVGPTIVDREYLSGQNKLSDGDFILGEEFWTIGDSIWVIGDGFAATFAASVDNDADQPLLSEEPFETPAGSQFTSSATIGRIPGYTTGRLRLRHVYTGGPFIYPDILPPYSTWDPSTHTDLDQIDLEVDGDTIRAGPSGLPNLIPNGSFDDGGGSLNGWIQVPGAGNWFLGTTGGHNGPNFTFTDSSTTPVLKVLASDATGAVVLPQHPRAVIAGEEYELWMVTRTNPGFTDTDGEVYLATNLAGDFVDAKVIETPHARPDDGHSEWRLLWTRFGVDDGYSNTAPAIAVLNQTLGQWDFDDATLIRKKGNIDSITSPVFDVTPSRTYMWRQNVRTNTGFISGDVSRAVVCSVPGRPDMEIMGPAISPTDGAEQIQEWEFTVPSGYDFAKCRFYCQDIEGASVILLQEGSSIVQTDTSTWIVESVASSATMSTGPISVASTAPAGAEQIHVELVAEANGIGWVAGGVSLIRVTASPATGNEIIADLLTEPSTGDPLSLTAGTITCPETIPKDWHILNMTNRAALEDYCKVKSIPSREFKVNADNTLDVGIAEDVFTDHGYDGEGSIVLLPSDIDVESLPSASADTEDRATDISIIGAEIETTTGKPLKITATAPVGSPPKDWNGRPVSRVKQVTDATVNHKDYADALAIDTAAKEGRPTLTLDASLSGVNTRPIVVPGDWVYAYHPDAGIRDTANVTTIDGDTVFPRKFRVLSLTRHCGPAHRMEIRRENGTTFDVADMTYIDWAKADAIDLTLGDRLVDFEADPNGGDVGRQYLRDRQSTKKWR